MDEDRFWSLIDELGGEVTDASWHRLYRALRRLEADEILAFEDRFAEVLFRLDLRSVAKQRWRDAADPRWLPRLPFISADNFLYARCAAVAEGRQTVEAVLTNHRRFRQTWNTEEAERLLSVSQEAYESATGQPWPDEHVSPYDYETGSNPDGGWKREGYPPGNPQ